MKNKNDDSINFRSHVTNSRCSSLPLVVERGRDFGFPEFRAPDGRGAVLLGETGGGLRVTTWLLWLGGEPPF